jgi:hypothetical protein
MTSTALWVIDPNALAVADVMSFPLPRDCDPLPASPYLGVPVSPYQVLD